jgi:transcriptional regulator with XRE-family HTH domain
MPRGPHAETIGQRLRRLRHERGLSQRDLAVPGVSYAYISRIEAGTRQPSVKALRKLAGKLGVSPEYLETGEELRDHEARELRLADAELQLRLGGDTAAAERTAQELLDEALVVGDIASATRALIALGFVAFVQNRHAEAVRHLEDAIELGQTGVTTRPDVHATLGRCYDALGHPERAVELFDDCLRQLEEDAPEDLPARTRFAVYLSYALTDMGDLGRAEAVVRDALDAAGELGDLTTRVHLYSSLARLNSMRDRPTAALTYARRAIALLEATDDTLHLARAHLLCAIILMLKDDPEHASRHLALAEQLFGPNPEPLDLAFLRTEQARHASLVGNAEDAIAFARESLTVLGPNDPAEQALARSVLAQGLALQGDNAAADEEFRSALDVLAEHGRWRDASRTARAWESLLRESGRVAEADQVRERAKSLGVPEEVLEH